MSDGGEPTRQPRSPREMFVAFTVLALQGFGGVLPVAQRELVDKRGWLTREQFLEVLSVGQVLPGPNVVNIALMVGDRFFGWRGAMASLAGILSAPTVIVLTLAALYTRFAAEAAVAGAVRGMGVASAGLIIAMAFKLAPTLKRNPLPLGVCAAAALLTWLAVGVLRVPMVYVVLGLGGAMFALAWWWLGRPGRMT